MRFIAALLALCAIAPAVASASGFSFGAGSSGGGLAGPKQEPAYPKIIATVGDIQIGSSCARWDDPRHPGGRDGCMQSQSDRAYNMFIGIEAAYSPDAFVVTGDMTELSFGNTDEVELYRDMIDSLPRNIYNKTYYSQGNHDVQSTCGYFEEFLHDAFDQANSSTYPGQVEREPWYRKRIDGVRIIGMSGPLFTHPVGLNCLNPDRVAVCYGDETPAIGAGTSLVTTCTAGTDCKSGKCGDLRALREEMVDFVERQLTYSNADGDVALVIGNHYKLCDSPNTDCDDKSTVLPIGLAEYQAYFLSRMTDLTYCSTGAGGDPDVFCSLDDGVTEGSHPCTVARVGADELCSEWAAGFDSYTWLKDALTEAFAPVMYGSGHVGAWAIDEKALMVALGNDYRDLVSTGAWRWDINDFVNHAIVYSIDSDGTTTILTEWKNATNPSPTIRDIEAAGCIDSFSSNTVTITAASLPCDIEFRADDVDYPDFIWDVIGEDACMTFVDGGGGAGSDPAELFGVLTVGAGCAASTYSGMTIEVEDGDAGAPSAVVNTVTRPLTVVVAP